MLPFIAIEERKVLRNESRDSARVSLFDGRSRGFQLASHFCRDLQRALHSSALAVLAFLKSPPGERPERRQPTRLAGAVALPPVPAHTVSASGHTAASLYLLLPFILRSRSAVNSTLLLKKVPKIPL